jgi:hypothetical protein
MKASNLWYLCAATSALTLPGFAFADGKCSRSNSIDRRLTGSEATLLLPGTLRGSSWGVSKRRSASRRQR